MIVDGLVTGIINIALFIIMVVIIRSIQFRKNSSYTPAYWISIDGYGIKLFLLGIVVAILYKLLIGVIGIINGTMVLTVDKSGLMNSLIYSLFSSFGFLGVALFEEGLFRGYIMQAALKKLPKVLAISLQAIMFGLIHYNNYSKESHTWVLIVIAILIGLIFGVIVIKTKSLMLVIGIHLMYDVCENVLFIDNSYRFDRFICFKSLNYTSTGYLAGLIYREFIELILLSIIAISLIVVFQKDILTKRSTVHKVC